MHKIATTADLQTELQRLLDYAQGQRPSRVVLASELRELSLRVASFTSDNKQLLNQLDKRLEKAHREASEANSLLVELDRKLRKSGAGESFERWLEKKTVIVVDAVSSLRGVRESLTRIEYQESSP